jgi:SAM-dependent methyltransferase
MDPNKERYLRGEYEIDDEDGPWKARYMHEVINAIPDKHTIIRYADIGCGQGSVLRNLVQLLRESGFPLEEIVGYDISPFPDSVEKNSSEIEFRQQDFLEGRDDYDLVTINDVLEHVSSPQEFLAGVGSRTRYAAVHIPMDDRLSVLLTNQYNYRIRDVGHISFWNPSSALNLISASGLQPLRCSFTGPGFLTPSGRERLIQKFAIPFRLVIGAISPGLAAVTVGGYSLAVLCRGKLP